MKIRGCVYQVLGSVIICFGVLVVQAQVTPSSEYHDTKKVAQLFLGANESSVARNSPPLVGEAYGTNKIFAEGSSSTVSISHEKSVTKSSNVSYANATNGANSSQPSNESLHSANAMRKFYEDMSKSSEASPYNKTASQKLNETILDFISGVDELAHANGTSSIKPRKGVVYMLPKKGDTDDVENSSLPVDVSCFMANQNICYNVDMYKNLDCICCNASDNFGKLIHEQPLVSCMNCTPVNKTPIDFSQPCNGICCKNTSENANEKSSADKNLLASNMTNSNMYNSSNLYQVVETQGNNLNKTENKNNKNSTEDSQVVNIPKKVKLKPSITKVPYDADVSNPFSKSKGEKYVPIIVSIFILPLVGVFIFLMWKKTRELWDRRYYKRMDFLIDGMYNDSY